MNCAINITISVEVMDCNQGGTQNTCQEIPIYSDGSQIFEESTGDYSAIDSTEASQAHKRGKGGGTFTKKGLDANGNPVWRNFYSASKETIKRYTDDNEPIGSPNTFELDDALFIWFCTKIRGNNVIYVKKNHLAQDC